MVIEDEEILMSLKRGDGETAGEIGVDLSGGAGDVPGCGKDCMCAFGGVGISGSWRGLRCLNVFTKLIEVAFGGSSGFW